MSENGKSSRMTRCIAEVPMRGLNHYRPRRCKNAATTPNCYCTIHDPAYLRKKAGNDAVQRAIYLNRYRRPK